ncbi:MAG: diaminopimelate decarboxylase [Clostridia bacterium]|nr:diaminopimelate decarboxylase [Clostridia bacterium]
MIHDNITVNEANHLEFAGLDTTLLAKKYGTPLMLLDTDKVRLNMQVYKNGLAKYFGETSYPCYASKALSIKEIYRIAKQENIGIDVVSSGEIFTAKSVDFPLGKAFFHGNNKTDFDVEYAIDNGVGYFVADNVEEINAISKIAGEKGVNQKILIRITPGIDPHTNAKITTGQVDSKFGTPIETGQAFELVEIALKAKNVELCGFHCHVGSQCFDSTSFIDAVVIMLSFIRDVKNLFGFSASILNLGGGYGVRYVDSDPQIDILSNLEQVGKAFNQTCDALNIIKPQVILEPGRSIVADAGLTLYTCGSFKTIEGYKNYVSIDGGMTDNPRYALYGSNYTVYNASKVNSDKKVTATIAGRCCESGDIIQENVQIPKPTRNDIIAVAVTGAYNYSMASNYNRITKPAVVSVENKTHKIIVKRESFEDLVKNEI